jgi:ABC-type multidrug transport system ATPase subunit
MIELREVTKRYGRRGAGTEAVRDVTLTVPSGAVWAVVGPNGAGKSTLLSLLLGFIRPSSGAITIAGDLPRDYLHEQGAGYLPERFSLPARWRTVDVIRLFARLERASPDDADRAISLLGLEPHLDRQTNELSRGLLQRLGLAQAILARRALIILDEPTEGLDPVWRVRLRDVISELRANDRTVVIASHDLTEVERIADRAVVLDKGAVRDVLDVRGRATAADYRLRLALPFDNVAGAFPDAMRIDELEYVVVVTGPADLSQRLGGLIALGALIDTVEPVRPGLEERVRGTLDGQA